MPLKILTQCRCNHSGSQKATPCAKTRHTMYTLLRPVYIFLAQLTVLSNPQNPRFYNTFQSTSFHTARGKESLYFTMCVNNALTTTYHHNRFTALFPGPPEWAAARGELLDFMVEGKINRGRHTDHPAGCLSIQTNQCLPPSSPLYFYKPDALPAAQPTASKHRRQLRHSD